MDVAKKLGDLIDSKWTLENVTLGSGCATLKVDVPDRVIKYDEFDPKSPLLQILLENFPARSTWIIEGMYKVEHRVRITIYQKLIQYQPLATSLSGYTWIDAYRKIWYAVKQEIDKILIKNKFNVSLINNIILGTWTDRLPTIALGRGTKTKKEPIVWTSELDTIAIYYQNEGLEVE